MSVILQRVDKNPLSNNRHLFMRLFMLEYVESEKAGFTNMLIGYEGRKSAMKMKSKYTDNSGKNVKSNESAGKRGTWRKKAGSTDKRGNGRKKAGKQQKPVSRSVVMSALRPKTRKVALVRQTVQASIPIQTVHEKENLIEPYEGCFIKIYRISNINYQTSTETEQDLVLTKWRAFLNSLGTNQEMQLTLFNRNINLRQFEEEVLLKVYICLVYSPTFKT